MKKLTNTQRAALKKAMEADQQQFFVQALTPTRRYAFPMDHTVRVVEMILNAPITRAKGGITGMGRLGLNSYR